jgi:hypothetical protein
MMASDFITRLSDSASLTDILIQLESFLDDLDIYVFKNWFEGEVVDGPTVERHWVSLTLKYEYSDMPDPEGGIRLMKYGALVKYRKAWQEDTDTKAQDIAALNARPSGNTQNYGMDSVLAQAKPKRKEIWLITIKVPRHFIDQLQQIDDLLDDNIDAEHVQGAKDSDLQAKDAYQAAPDDPTAAQDETTGEVDQQAAAV